MIGNSQMPEIKSADQVVPTVLDRLGLQFTGERFAQIDAYEMRRKILGFARVERRYIDKSD